MKRNVKIKGPPGFELGTSRSALESSFIKNVNKSHYSYFLITCWLQSGMQANMGDEWSIYYNIYDCRASRIKNLAALPFPVVFCTCKWVRSTVRGAYAP